MRVWVLETGCYEDRFIQGVYSTAEKAMAAWPARENMQRVIPGCTIEWVYYENWGEWYLAGADWGDAAHVTPYEVDA